MTDPDRLAMIEANMASSRRNLRPPYIGENDADWLVEQVKGLREDRARLKSYFDQVEAERDRLQRFEAMFGDCARHRDQAERRARRYMDIVRQVAELVAPDEEE